VKISPRSPRRQRKALYTADPFERRRRMSVPLSRELRRRFHARSLPVRKGDTVRVLSGSFAGREERVARLDRRAYALILDNITLKTGEEKLKALPIRPSHLVITRLNLSDPWRRRSLRVSEEELTPEERGETPEPEETPSESLPAPAPETKAEAPEKAPEPEPEPEATAPEAKPTRKRAAKKTEPAEAEGETL
jgi:large subunit ribosomal protein L24